MITPRRAFRVTWVLHNQLALGPAPLKPTHLERLQQEGIRGVLSLCDPQEHLQLEALPQLFRTARVVLPDHRSGRPPNQAEIQAAIDALATLRCEGPVYVHCLASMERSPLVCLAWLMRERGLTRLEALDYLSQTHPGTNPLPEQLAALARFEQ